MRFIKSFCKLMDFVKSDLNRFLSHSTALGGQTKAQRMRMVIDCILFKAGFQAVFLYRVSHWCYLNKWIFCARALMRLNLALNAIDIGFSAEIGKGLLIGHPTGIIIGHKIKIGKNTTILSGVLFGVKNWEHGCIDKLPKVGDNCVFCTRAAVLGGCTIGDNVVVGINSVVDKDIESNSFAIGHPAQCLAGRGKEMVDKWCL